MKKIYVLVIALAISSSIIAQKTKFGPIVGVNFSTVDTRTDVGQKMTTGYHAGGIIEGNFGSSKFGAQICLLYSTKGYQFDDTYSGVKVNTTATLSYIELPYYFTYSFGNDNFKVMPMVGFYSGYALSGKVKSEGSGNGVKVSETQDLKIGSKKTDDINAFDVGLNFGICSEIKGFQVS